MKQLIDLASTRTNKTTSKCVISTSNKCMLKNSVVEVFLGLGRTPHP